MGTLFRSRHMQRVQLFMQIEAAHDTVDELGKVGLVQFVDMNPKVNAFSRNFVNDVKRCDELERKLRYFEDQLRRNNFPLPKRKPAHIRYEDFTHADDSAETGVNLDELEVKFEEIEKELLQLSANQETLDRHKNELEEMKHVLDEDDAFFGQGGYQIQNDSEDYGVNQPLINREDESSNSNSLGFITGVILRSKIAAFERVLWRAMRGNLFMKQAEIPEDLKDPSTGELQEKNVFIVFYQGRRSEAKIKKLCEAFGANLYPCPQNSAERHKLKEDIRSRLADLREVLERTEKQNRKTLSSVGQNLEVWKIQVLKEKSIYHTMNLFLYDTGRRCLIAEGWTPCDIDDMAKIREALRVANNKSGALVHTILNVVDSHKPPPTYFVTNSFTDAFQLIIDSYGVPRYREINPAPFTIITFPFLFGVMFGDVGHGFLLLLLGLYLVLNEKTLGKIKLPEMVDTIFDGRWVFLFMSVFSIYCGFLYNELFGVPMDIFGTNWEYIYPVTERQFAVMIDEEYVYPFGVDPLWKGANNELDYYNSLKMKMSVLMGVVQMLLGICMSLLNHIYFCKYLNIFMEFIPQMVFIIATFGYMDILIVWKWATNFNTEKYIYQFFVSPRLLNLLIQMFLTPFKLPVVYFVYDGQIYVQFILLILAFIAVPWMLIPKPFILKYWHEREERRTQHEKGFEAIKEGDSSSSHSAEDDDDEEEHFDFGELFTHQCIHTIEYVLGCISNTASYLRLWALSLAHSELSEVFWERVMEFTLNYRTWYMIFAGWATWAALTVGVLLIMESLSAFLHALRLHWVEFQNKFYQADGHKFIPYSYVQVLRDDEENSAYNPN